MYIPSTRDYDEMDNFFVEIKKFKKAKKKAMKKLKQSTEHYDNVSYITNRSTVLPAALNCENNVPKYILHDWEPREQVGVVFGSKTINGVDYRVGKSADIEGHIALFGGTASGKSSCVVIPTLTNTWNSRFFAIDIKGELKREYDKWHEKRGTKVFTLKPNEVGITFDPFDLIRKNGEDDLVSNVRSLVFALIPLPINVHDPVWIQTAQSFLTAAIIYYFQIGASFIDSMNNIMTMPPVTLIEEIGESNNKLAKIFINNFIDNPKLHESQFLMSVCQELTNRLSIFASDPQVIKAFTPCSDSLKWEDLESHNIFLSVPEERLEQYSGVITLILTQIIRYLEKRPEMHSPEGANTDKILLMLDEFPRLGKLDVIANAFSTLRSKKVDIMIICQSLAQLDFIYGKEFRRIILDNCSYKVILNATDPESQEYFSKLVGTLGIPNHAFSKSTDPNYKVIGYNYQISEVQEPIILPHDFATLTDVVLITPTGFCRVDKLPYYNKKK